MLGPNEAWLSTDSLTVRLDCPPDALLVLSDEAERILMATESGEHDDYAAWLVGVRERFEGEAISATASIIEKSAKPATPAADDS